MANRRILKKKITAICGNIFADCIVIAANGHITPEKRDELLSKILVLQNDMISRVNHTESGSERLYYKRLKEDFTAQIQELSNSIQEA